MLTNDATLVYGFILLQIYLYYINVEFFSVFFWTKTLLLPLLLLCQELTPMDFF